MKLQCTKCNYVTDKQEIPKRCPYCGEADTMIKAKSAQDILNESVEK